MNRQEYKTSIPAHAVETIEAFHTNGVKKSVSYFVSGEKVGHREWDEEGCLDYECGMKGDVRHGYLYRFYSDGQLLEKAPYLDGREHGTGKQWSENGQLLVKWKLIHGTGLDLWCDNITVTLAEEHYCPSEEELGYTRQWNKDETTIWQEYFYVLGKGYHGIWREWNSQGKLRRGFPRYYVKDRRVTKRQYLKGCEKDLTLPRYQPEDDRPHRELPAEYLAQRKRLR